MAPDNRQEELDTLIKKAQSQPGITELMRAYGRYDEVLEQSRAYVERRASPVKTTVSNHSS
ncbi:MAG: hypothetical protein ACQXXC_03500 [Methanolinea tarda]|jgi:hypothetical protein